MGCTVAQIGAYVIILQAYQNKAIAVDKVTDQRLFSDLVHNDNTGYLQSKTG